ncbi:MAG TPA: hypothetical protein VF855_09870 [Acidimicrobiales bacterium]
MTTSAAATTRARGDDHGARPNAVQYDPRETVGKNQPSPTERELASSLRATDVAVAAAGVNAQTPRNLRLLVLAADGKETDLAAIEATLHRIGVPHDTILTVDTTLTESTFEVSGRGLYNGVILTTGDLVYYDGTWKNALTWEEWNILWSYEARYGIRQVTSQTWPEATYNLINEGSVDTLTAPVETVLTDAGKAVFDDLNPATPIRLTGAYLYLATIGTDPTMTTTPLLTTHDGYVVASITTYPDGRQNLAVTVANNAYLLHSQLLSYGLVSWVTQGVFLGERHVNLDAQVDDMLLDDDVWDVAALSDATGLTYRMSGDDLAALVGWQAAARASSPLLAGVRLELAFNGEGATGIYENDTLTPAVRSYKASFSWVNHSWSHESMDSPATRSQVYVEITRNDSYARRTLKLPNYQRDSLVQPDISGLTSSAFWAAAADAGIKYVLSNASYPEWANPSPNAGIYSSNGILIIPRRANNLFYNVTTPSEVTSEYNFFYWGWIDSEGVFHEGEWHYFDEPQTYEQILDHESDFLLSYMLTWDLDPWMFHQANLRAYDGVHSVLGDLLDATFAKYLAAYELPVRNLTQHEVGGLMAQRMAFDTSGASAVLTPCTSLTVRVAKAATVAVTGVAFGTSETYGGDPISYLRLKPKAAATIPMSCSVG